VSYITQTGPSVQDGNPNRMYRPYRDLGGVPKYSISSLIASTSVDLQSSLEDSCLCEGDICSSSQRTVRTRSSGGLTSVVFPVSSRSVPLSHPRGVRCQSVYSSLSDTLVILRFILRQEVGTSHTRSVSPTDPGNIECNRSMKPILLWLIVASVLEVAPG